MAFKSNYVKVSPNVLMDPTLKTTIKLGRLNFESGGDQEINVYYDPEIEPGRMIVPVGATPYFVQPSNPKLRVNPNKLVPFYSKKGRKISTFSLSGSLNGMVSEWSMNWGKDRILLKSKLISKEMIDGVSNNSLDFLIDALSNLARLENWPVMYGVKPSAIRIRLKREAVDGIPDRRVPPNWVVDGDYLIVGEREVRT